MELKHIVGYLPYGLRVLMRSCDDSPKPNIKVVNLIKYELITNNVIFGFVGHRYEIESERVKPILRPLSDLTKEIEVDGEKFVPIEYFEIGEEGNDNFPFEFDYGNCKLIKTLINVSNYELNNDINYLPNAVIEKLYQWHFDIHNLINQNIAIDINQINK